MGLIRSIPFSNPFQFQEILGSAGLIIQCFKVGLLFVGSITYERNRNHISSDKHLRAEVMAFPELWPEMTAFSKEKTQVQIYLSLIFPFDTVSSGTCHSMPQSLCPVHPHPLHSQQYPTQCFLRNAHPPHIPVYFWDSLKVQLSFYFLSLVGHERGKGFPFLLLCF